MRLSPEVPADVSVPYRCLYAKKIKNLFLGGRHISTSHVAFAAVRVMRTLGMLGEVVGMAAAVCIKNNGFPRDVYTDYFDELKALMINGVKVPSTTPEDIAAKLITSRVLVTYGFPRTEMRQK